MTEEFLFPPRKSTFDRSLSIKPRKQLEINIGRQAVGCLYFGGCEELSGYSKSSVPAEKRQVTAAKSLLLNHDVLAALSTGYGKSLIFQSFVVAKEQIGRASCRERV